MNDIFATYSGNTREGDGPVTELEEAMQLIAETFFQPSAYGPGCWLVYATETGEALGVIMGLLRPIYRAKHKMRTMNLPASFAEVPETFAPLLVECGSGALRWDGTKVVATGS